MKKNSLVVLGDIRGGPAVEVPADVPEALMERLDDLELSEVIRSRRHEKPIPVSLDDL
ncbi:antitoxin [Pseudomonas sp. B21-053]|uniref:antitoxin n=1 Tax=Pseudomonas sp. B21-053 TaxID=2895493 RepID=UPI00222F404F|nr:antitoxin [Pseudomonas sp. B21-053]UZE15095.1 antitoxin [Pseudomonas sp. B21-053]